MLNHDEEEVLKILLKLYKEQNARDITGSFKNFPVKYQICYKEIISSLDEKKFVINFAEFMAGDFVVTIMPPSFKYFENKEIDNDEVVLQELEPISESNITENQKKYENQTVLNSEEKDNSEKQKENKNLFNESLNKKNINNKTKADDFSSPEEYSISINILIKLKVLEKQAEMLGGEYKTELKGIFDTIRNIIKNLKISPVIKPDPELIKKIFICSEKFPWLYGELINIFGSVFMKTLIG